LIGVLFVLLALYIFRRLIGCLKSGRGKIKLKCIAVLFPCQNVEPLEPSKRVGIKVSSKERDHFPPLDKDGVGVSLNVHDQLAIAEDDDNSGGFSIKTNRMQ
jgi:hypothetical protein